MTQNWREETPYFLYRRFTNCEGSSKYIGTISSGGSELPTWTAVPKVGGSNPKAAPIIKPLFRGEGKRYYRQYGYHWKALDKGYVTVLSEL